MIEYVHSRGKITSDNNPLGKLGENATALRVAEIVTGHSGITLTALRGNARAPHICEARFCFSYILKTGFSYTNTEIARLLNQDQTSVGRGARVFADRLARQRTGVGARELLHKSLDDLAAEGLV